MFLPFSTDFANLDLRLGVELVLSGTGSVFLIVIGVRFRVYSTLQNMMPRIVRFLVFVLSIQLALPPAWCCFFATVRCCYASVEPVETKAEVKCFCCGSVENYDAAAAPKKATHPSAPAKPCDSPCCVQMPTTLIGRDAGLDHTAIVAAYYVFMGFEHVASRVDLAHANFDPVCSLHLLHCCWLC